MIDGIYHRIDGQMYRWIGPGLGAQLESVEWSRSPAGTRRRLAGFDVTVFQTSRHGLKVRHSWGVSSCGTLDEHHARIREFSAALLGARAYVVAAQPKEERR